MDMNVDIEFLKKTANARYDVGNWLMNRPNIGLDVTDVATLVGGFDYLAYIIKQLTGKDVVSSSDHVEVYHPEITITYGE